MLLRVIKCSTSDCGASFTYGFAYKIPIFLYSETNLKCRQCLVEVAELGHEVVKFDGLIRCETPNNLLNKFHGVLQWNNKEYVLIT